MKCYAIAGTTRQMIARALGKSLSTESVRTGLEAGPSACFPVHTCTLLPIAAVCREYVFVSRTFSQLIELSSAAWRLGCREWQRQRKIDRVQSESSPRVRVLFDWQVALSGLSGCKSFPQNMALTCRIYEAAPMVCRWIANGVWWRTTCRRTTSPQALRLSRPDKLLQSATLH